MYTYTCVFTLLSGASVNDCKSVKAFLSILMNVQYVPVETIAEAAFRSYGGTLVDETGSERIERTEKEELRWRRRVRCT